MAFRADGTNFLANTSSLVSNNWTMACFFRANSRSTTTSFDTALSAGNTTTLSALLCFGGSGTAVFGLTDNTGAVPSGAAQCPITPADNEWWFGAMTHNGTTLRGYARRLDHRVLQQMSLAKSSMTITSMRFGTSTFDGTDFFDGRLAGMRIWNRVLSTAEIMAESFSLMPKTRARLHTYVQEDTRVNLGGRTASLTLSGSYLHEPGPPVTPRANQVIILDHVQGSANKVLVVDPGSIAITGTAATFGVSMPADAGAVTITGTDATPRVTMPADPGSVTISGTAATLLETHKITADPGSVTITGTDATLRATMPADPGSVVITGTDMTPRVVMPADPGSVVISGTDATLVAGTPNKSIAADSGSFAITGTAAALGITMPADSGVFTISGQAATLAVGKKLTVDPGSFVISGTAAGLVHLSRLVVDPGAFVITGSDVILTYVPIAPIGSTIDGSGLRLIRRRRRERERRRLFIQRAPSSIIEEGSSPGMPAQVPPQEVETIDQHTAGPTPAPAAHLGLMAQVYALFNELDQEEDATAEEQDRKRRQRAALVMMMSF